jgi:hypothetical protein
LKLKYVIVFKILRIKEGYLTSKIPKSKWHGFWGDSQWKSPIKKAMIEDNRRGGYQNENA